MVRDSLSKSRFRSLRRATQCHRMFSEPLEERVMLDAGGSPATAEFITNGSFSAALTSHGDMDFYAFFAKAGTTITAAAWATNLSASTSAQLDPIIGIFNPSGNLVVSDDDGGELPGNRWRAEVSTTVTTSGVWYVGVTDFPDFEFKGTAGNGPGANVGAYQISIAGIAPLEIGNVTAQHDSNSSKDFGKYLPGARLDNEFTVEMGVKLPTSFKLTYRFGNGSEKTAGRSGDNFTFTQDMGAIDPKNSTLRLRLQPPSGNAITHTAEVEFYENLSAEITATINGAQVPIEQLRLIAGVHAAIPVKVSLGHIDFFQHYSTQGFSIGVPTGTSRWSNSVSGKDSDGFLAELPAILADVGEGFDYQIALLAKQKPVTSSKGLKVVSLPDWTKDIGIKSSGYSQGIYEITLKEKQFSKDTKAIEQLTLGLLDSKPSKIDLKAQLKVVASVIQTASPAPEVQILSSSGNVTLLGKQVLLFNTADSPVQIATPLNAEKLTLDSGLRLFTPKDKDIVLLEKFAPDFKKKLELPTRVLAIGRSAGLTIDASIEPAVKPGSVTFGFDIIVTKDLKFHDSSFVRFTATADGSVSGTASATWLKISEDNYVAKVEAKGGVNFGVALQATFKLSGSILSPTLDIDNSESAAVLGVRPFFRLEGSLLSNKYNRTFVNYPENPNTPPEYYKLWNNWKTAGMSPPPVEAVTPPPEPTGPLATPLSSFPVTTTWSDLGNQAIAFGSATGRRESARISAANTTEENVLVHRATIVGEGFEMLVPLDRPWILEPGQSLTLDVRLIDAAAPAHAILRIEADDLDAPVEIPLDYDPIDPVDVLPPHVTSVALRHSGWGETTPAVVAADILAEAGLDQVVVAFSEDVVVSADDLYLRGGASGDIEVVDFHYENRVATWTLAAPLARDRYAIDLAAAIRDQVDRSLLPQATTRFMVLPGDANRDGEIGFADFVLVSNAFGLPAAGHELADLNGDGEINFADFVIVSNSFGQGHDDLPLPALFPQWTPVADQSMAPGEVLQLSLSASDENASDQLTYLLVNPPPGAAIDPQTGHFVYEPPDWMALEDVEVTVAVDDDSAAQLRSLQTFTIRVRPVNEPPVLVEASPQQVEQGQTWSFLVEADDPNWPLDRLHYSLVSGPAGAAIDPETGLLTWTPDYAAPPSIETFVVRVTDQEGEYDEASIELVVLEVNLLPNVVEPGLQSVSELDELDIVISASDENTWNTLTFRLGDDAPEGATIDPVSGRLRWTPGETDDGIHVITVIVSDNGAEPLETQVHVAVQVLEADSPVTLQPIGDHQIAAGAELTFTALAFDADDPEGVVYSLEGAPEGATIDPESGAFSWIPGMADLGSHTFVVRAANVGDSAPDAVATVTVEVTPEQTPPVLEAFAVNAGASGTARNLITALYVSDESAIVSLRVVFNFMAPGEDFDLLPYLDEVGTLTISSALYALMHDGPLPDGHYEATFTAVDEWGNQSIRYFELILDRVAPTVTAELDPLTDSGRLGDLRTSFETVVIRGQTEPGATVDIYGTLVEVDAEGNFSATYPLAYGLNNVYVNVEDAAGNWDYVELIIVRVLENSADTFGYEAASVTPEFVDISTTGTAVLAGSDNSSIRLTPAVLNGFEFGFYGLHYNELFVHSNGIITFGAAAAQAPSYGQPLAHRNTPAMIAPLWQDLLIFGPSDNSGVYYEVREENGFKKLIVQWHDVLVISEGSYVTFQAILDSSDGSIQFNYLDLDTGTINGEGADALVGIKQSGDQYFIGAAISLAGYTAPNAFVGTGKSTRLSVALPDVRPPLLDVRLAVDTHIPDDRVTSNPSVRVAAFDHSYLASLTARFDDAPADWSVNILPALQAGYANLNTAWMNAIYHGDALPDGQHVLNVTAVDQLGNERTVQLDFTLDREAPVFTGELDPDFDTGEIGDLRTSLASVQVILRGEPGMELVFRGNDYIMDETGTLVIPNVELGHLGISSLHGYAIDLAGNVFNFRLDIIRVSENGTWGPDSFGYLASIDTPQFVDISTTGTPILVGEDDSFQMLGAAELSGFEFSFYGQTYSELYVSTNGLITFGAGYDYFNPLLSLYYQPNEATIAVLANDLLISGAWDSGVYYEVVGEPGSQRLIVQWHNVQIWGSGGLITFQAVLDASDHSIQFNYLDLVTSGQHNEGASAVVGIKNEGDQFDTGQVLILAWSSAPNEFVGTGLSTRFTPPVVEEAAPLSASFAGRLASPAVDAVLVDAFPVVDAAFVDHEDRADAGIALLDHGAAGDWSSLPFVIAAMSSPRHEASVVDRPSFDRIEDERVDTRWELLDLDMAASRRVAAFQPAELATASSAAPSTDALMGDLAEADDWSLEASWKL